MFGDIFVGVDAMILLKKILRKIGVYRIFNQKTFLVECYVFNWKFYEYFSSRFLVKLADYVVEHTSIRTSNQVYALEHLMSQIQEESFSEYRDKFLNRDVVILGAGPTMKDFDRSKFKDAIFIGVNKTIVQYPDMDYYFLSDWSTALEYQIVEMIKHSSAKKFFNIGIWNDEYYNGGWFMPPLDFAKECNASFYFSINYTAHQLIQQDISKHPLFGYGTVVMSSFHFALFCHPKRIYIVGCDCSDGGHFDAKEVVYPSHHVVRIKEEWRRMSLFAKYYYPDVEIISINPVGLKGLFKDEYL